MYRIFGCAGAGEFGCVDEVDADLETCGSASKTAVRRVMRLAGDVMLWVAAAVTLVTGGSYLMATLRNLS